MNTRKILAAILAGTIAATALGSAAFAHGRLVTGSQLYTTSSPAEVTHQHDQLAGKSDNGVQAREFRAVQQGTHWLHGETAF